MNKSFRFILFGAALAMHSAPVVAGPRIELGRLNCSVVEETKNIISEKLHLNCTFTKSDGSMGPSFVGEIDRKGLTIGSDLPKSLAWIVATVGDPKTASLAGTYLGAEAGAALAEGGGVDWLAGGFNKEISLQPYALEGETGIGISIGVQKLTLSEG
jgi:hypothetical protein